MPPNGPLTAITESSRGIRQFHAVFAVGVGSGDQKGGGGQPKSVSPRSRREWRMSDPPWKRIPGSGKNFQRVDELLFEGKAVPENLRLVNIEEKKARISESQISQIRADLKAMEQEGVLNDPKRVTGLAKGLQECLIEPNFVGLKYYRIYLTDERMWASLTNTLVFTGISVGVELVLGIAIALLINRQFVGRGWCGPRC